MGSGWFCRPLTRFPFIQLISFLLVGSTPVACDKLSLPDPVATYPGGTLSSGEFQEVWRRLPSRYREDPIRRTEFQYRLARSLVRYRVERMQANHDVPVPDEKSREVRIHLPAVDLDARELAERRELSRQAGEEFRGLEELKNLMKIVPHRMTGTESGRRSLDFVAAKLRGYGLQVRREPFDITIWRRLSAELVVRPDDDEEYGAKEGKARGKGRKAERKLNTSSFAYTPVASNVSAPVYDVGDGLAADFRAAGERLKGKIVLSNLHVMYHDSRSGKPKPGNPHRSTRAAWAVKAGAAGIIFVNKYSGGVLTTGTVSKTDEPISIPALCIGLADGRAIRRMLARRSVVARIKTRADVERIRSHNLIATLPGLERPDERVIIGAHLDSWDLSPGAIDNGIGAFTVLDIARSFAVAGIVPGRTLEFAFWMGEEQGLVGSLNFIRDTHAAGKLDTIKLYVNIDMHGNPRGFDTEGRAELAGFFDETVSRIRALNIPFAGRRRNNPSLHSDNVPFAVQGIPVMQMISALDGRVYAYYHSNQDELDLIDPAHMRRSVLIMSQAMLHLSTAARIPGVRLSKKDTRRMFEKYGIAGVLRKRGFDLRGEASRRKPAERLDLQDGLD